MKFGRFPLATAEGAILAHGISHAGGSFKKGRVLSGEDIALLTAAGHDSVIAAGLEADDVPEDVAAHQIATAACGPGAKVQAPFTGRANLNSSVHGLIVVDEARIKALNHLHESLTLATLTNHAVVQHKQMLATIKVIPFAMPRGVLEKALDIIGKTPLVTALPFQRKQAGLIITRLPQTKAQLITKSETAIRSRLAALDAELSDVIVCDHTQLAIAAAIEQLKHRDPILVFGASAIVDRADVIPAGLVEAGGSVTHLGMPVDPGNLLMLGRVNASKVIGVPSCARSPKTNGFDWILERLIAGIDVSASDIMDLGAGGLLAEISSRPQPREANPLKAPRIAAIVLAAGKSLRMGTNKMLANFRGEPMLRVTVASIANSSVDQIIVVTGHERLKAEAILNGIKLRTVHNPHFADGLSTSLRCGLEAISETADAAIICLGDMPLIEPHLIDRLIAAYNPVEQRTIVVPTYRGQLGNPVLWGANHFIKLMSLEGDRGARSLIDQLRAEVVEIESTTNAVLRDADTPEALADLAHT
jgi:molybdenum cofactor cytidylyltransferase